MPVVRRVGTCVVCNSDTATAQAKTLPQAVIIPQNKDNKYMTQREKLFQEVYGDSISLAEWQEKMKEGFILSLRIKRWRARKSTSLYELGILPEDVEEAAIYRELFGLGTNLLLPQEAIRTLETTERLARENLKNHTLDTPFGRFLPITAYESWKQENEKYQAKFYAKRDEMVTVYPRLKLEIQERYEVVAKRTYFLLLKQYEREGKYSFIQEFPNEWQFVEHYKQNIIGGHIIPEKAFHDSFIYQVSFSKIQLEGLNFREKDIESPEAWETEQSAKRAAAMKRREMLLAAERELVEKVRSQKENMIDSFLNSLLIQTRTLAYDAVTSVLSSIQREDTLQGRPAIQLRKLIEKIEQLNFAEDRDIDRMLTSLNSILETPAKERDLEEVQRQLRAIAVLSRGTVLALGDEPPRTEKEVNLAELGIAAFPSEEEIREAREELSIRQVPATNQEPEEREERTEVPETVGLKLWAARVQENEREERN